MSKRHQYYLFNKPYGVLSQFTKEAPHHATLADYLSLESDVYPVGRLDKDSEGLLLLTNDNRLKTQLLNPKSKKQKTYLAQLDGSISDDAIEHLQAGVAIKVNKKIYTTLPATVRALPDFVYPNRTPPVRYRANIPTSWIRISIHEGKNRQIRRMCASVRFPVLRLIRIAIGRLKDDHLPPGEVRVLTEREVKLLRH